MHVGQWPRYTLGVFCLPRANTCCFHFKINFLKLWFVSERVSFFFISHAHTHKHTCNVGSNVLSQLIKPLLLSECLCKRERWGLLLDSVKKQQKNPRGGRGKNLRSKNSPPAQFIRPAEALTYSTFHERCISTFSRQLCFLAASLP